MYILDYDNQPLTFFLSKVDQLLYFQIPDSYWSETSEYCVADKDSCTIRYTLQI